MSENKYKTICADVVRVYHEDEDYCRMTLDMLKHAIADMDADATRDAYNKLTKCFDDLAKTVKEISIRFREASKLLDDCLGNLRKEKKDEGQSA